MWGTELDPDRGPLWVREQWGKGQRSQRQRWPMLSVSHGGCSFCPKYFFSRPKWIFSKWPSRTTANQTLAKVWKWQQIHSMSAGIIPAWFYRCVIMKGIDINGVLLVLILKKNPKFTTDRCNMIQILRFTAGIIVFLALLIKHERITCQSNDFIWLRVYQNFLETWQFFIWMFFFQWIVFHLNAFSFRKAAMGLEVDESYPGRYSN